MKKAFYIIIRGPLGCGKSTISQRLAKELDAEYIAVDKVLDEYNLTKDKEEGYISQKSFLKVNEIISKRVKIFLKKGKSVIFDGNFYWKSVIEDLISKLDYDYQVFTLKASVNTCIERDIERGRTHGEAAAREVYKKSMSFDYGKIIDIDDKTVEETISMIKKELEMEIK
jgi:tRNA uridine 5-carbamoylmethylation protein Kti12